MHFYEALFETALVAFGTGLYFVMEATKKWIAWVVMVVGAGGMLYSVFRPNHTESLGLPTWVYLLTATWILVGLDIYDRKKGGVKFSRSIGIAEWREGFVNPRFEIVVDHKFENEEITVDNKSFRRCGFKNVKLLFHGVAPFEFVEGTTVDAGTVYFTTDDPAVKAFDLMQTQFASIPGARIQHGALDKKGHDVPLPTVTAIPVAALPKSSQYPIPALRLQMFGMCSELQGFLGEFGEEPKVKDIDQLYETVAPWRTRVGAAYRLRYGGTMRTLRDEIAQKTGITDRALDNAIYDAATDRLFKEEAVKAIIAKLCEIAPKVNA